MNEQTLLPPETPYQKLAVEMAGLLVNSGLSTVRASIGQRAGLTHGGSRDIYASCGYPLELTIFDYYNAYKRGDVARRVVEAFPRACWMEEPEVWDNEGQEALPEQAAEETDPGTLFQKDLPTSPRYSDSPGSTGFGASSYATGPKQNADLKATEPQPVERKPGVNVPPLPEKRKPVVRGKGKAKAEDTPFMKEFKALAKKVKLYSYLQKVDKLAGIGRYGVLYLGFNDTTDVTQEVTPGAELLYVQAFREDCASASGLEGDVTNPRYGLPKGYNLRTAQGITNPNAMRGAYPVSTDVGAGQLGLNLSGVHWSRCVHIVEDPDDGELYGTPRLEPVWNRLQDINTAVSASGETFWRSGFQRLFARIDPGEGVVFGPKQREKLEEKLQDMMMNLTDHVVGQGLDIKAISGQTADPTAIVDTCLKLIGATTEIPYRILTGSEQAELAGSQDGDNFKATVNGRRNNHCAPNILRPVIDRLIKYKVLSAPASGEYMAEWKKAEEQKPEVKAQVLTARIGAVTGYLSGGADQLIPRKAFLVDEMDVDPDVADQYLDEADKAVALAEEQSKQEMELAMQQMPGEPPAPGQSGKAPPFGGKPSPFPKKSGGFPPPKNNVDSFGGGGGGIPEPGATPWWKKIAMFLTRFSTQKQNGEEAGPPVGTPVTVDLEGDLQVNARITGRNEYGELTATGDDGSVYTLPE